MQLQAPGRNRTCGPTIRATPIELINYVASSLYALKPAFIKDFKKRSVLVTIIILCFLK